MCDLLTLPREILLSEVLVHMANINVCHLSLTCRDMHDHLRPILVVLRAHHIVMRELTTNTVFIYHDLNKFPCYERTRRYSQYATGATQRDDAWKITRMPKNAPEMYKSVHSECFWPYGETHPLVIGNHWVIASTSGY